MAGVNEAIAREFFESLGFLVRQPHKYVVIARTKRPDEEIDFLALNPAPQADVAPPTGARVLTGAELRGVERAVVSVRGWHTEKVGPSLLNVAPQLVRFAQDAAQRRARAWMGPGPATRILCLSALPASPALRRKALELLAEKGVDGVLLFPTMLRELIRSIEANKNYEKSDLLQTLRILKTYDLLRDEQLELFRRAARRARPMRDSSV
jgi:hypothetical protein